MSWWPTGGRGASGGSGGIVQSHYTLGEELGSGTYGRVLCAIRKRDHQPFAVKEIPKFKVRNLQDVRNEVSLMTTLRHPNILHIEDWFDSARLLHIVIELCTGGELYEAICAQGSLDEHDVVGVMRQVLAGLRHCHDLHVIHDDNGRSKSVRIVHLDLKPQNLLFKDPIELSLIHI